MITDNITIVLYVTGSITSSMILLFIYPGFVLEKILRVKADEGLAGIIERHWGMVISLTGILLIWAGYDPLIRKPVVLCVSVSKLSFVLLMLFKYREGYVRNFSFILVFDSLCVVLFAVYLLGVF